jgi:putative tricarboxylic transport membrane protein
LFIAYYSRTYLKLGILIRPGAGFIPFYIGVALVVLGLVWFLSSLVTRKLPVKSESGCAEEIVATDGERRNLIFFRFLPAVLLILLYAWLFEKIGYLVSTLLFMVGWQKVVEREGWLKTVVIAVLCAGAMYGLFAYLLKIALPTGSWLS